MKPAKALLAILIFVTVLLFAAIARIGHAEPEEGFQEDRVKAAFVYNFAKFVEWPQGALGKAEDPIIIGVLGNDRFNGALEQTIRNKTAQNRPLIIRRLTAIDEPKDCHILFFCVSEENRVIEELNRIKQLPILTVSDLERFSKQGGMVTLITEANRVRFEVNLTAVESAGLKVSSQLLKLATIIRKE